MSVLLVKNYRTADANTTVPKITTGTTYSVGDIRRAGQTCFMRCTQAGTTTMDWSTSFSSSDYTVTQTNGTTKWVVISGKVGEVANAWDIAAYWGLITSTNGASSAGSPAPGLLYNSDHSGNTVYAAASDTEMLGFSPRAGLAQYGLYTQYANINEWKFGLAPTERETIPNIPASPARIVSADDSVPLASGVPTYQKGYTVLAQDVDYYGSGVATVGMGCTEWVGVVFNIDSSSVVHRYQFAMNTRMCSINLYTDCDFNLYGNRPTGYSPLLVFGKYGTRVVTTTALDCSIRGGLMERREFNLCNFNLSVDTTCLGFWYGCTFNDCTFTTTYPTFHAAGMFLLGNRTGAEIVFENCDFLKPIPQLFQDTAEQGPFKYIFKYCTFDNTDLTKLIDNIPNWYFTDLTVEFFGCGAAGGLDPSSYLRLHTGYTITKQLNISRSGAFADEWGSQYSYYVVSKPRWLKPRYVFAEMPHIQSGIGEGHFLVTMYIAVPPTQLLNNDEFFIYAMGPDRDGATDDGYMPINLDGLPLANTYTSRRFTENSDLVTYPTVAMSWSGLPGGWVTQAISFHMRTDTIGRVYVVPLFAKPDAEFIMCGTLGIDKVG